MVRYGLRRRKALLIRHEILIAIPLFLLGCEETAPIHAIEICNNGVDDDYDTIVDCDDISCLGDPACRSVSDGDGDIDADSDVDGDGDGDVDADVDGDADGDLDSDVDADMDIADADDEESCDPEVDPCDGLCSRDEHCALALDMWSCCGGFPHDFGGETVVCAAAAVTTTIDDDPCILSWSPTDPIPDVPPECTPICTGVLCGECVEPVSSICVDGVCLSMADNECRDVSDCEADSSCVDVDLDGRKECISGDHECDIDDDCLPLYPDCDGCICEDIDLDGLRDCDCYGCGHLCFDDLDCDVHEFCDASECIDYGSEACRVPLGNLDCEPCYLCEPTAEDPMRGTCVPDTSDPECE